MGSHMYRCSAGTRCGPHLADSPTPLRRDETCDAGLCMSLLCRLVVRSKPAGMGRAPSQRRGWWGWTQLAPGASRQSRSASVSAQQSALSAAGTCGRWCHTAGPCRRCFRCEAPPSGKGQAPTDRVGLQVRRYGSQSRGATTSVPPTGNTRACCRPRRSASARNRAGGSSIGSSVRMNVPQCVPRTVRAPRSNDA